ncbi:hypothetical protein FOZ61_002378 [Perkinsus olseni]|uniref:Uncharacterized protein n=1 Tax=Perkinsus olseni TaxID=32597 RepID=A0A7J6LUQ0_PEROL|nr:hypothetical protein FOZ61_002378 [Perkinsus olseni]
MSVYPSLKPLLHNLAVQAVLCSFTLGVLATQQDLLPSSLVRPGYPLVLLLCLSLPTFTMEDVRVGVITVILAHLLQRVSALLDTARLGIFAFSFIKAGLAEESVKCLSVTSVSRSSQSLRRLGVWSALAFAVWENITRVDTLLTDSPWVAFGALTFPPLVHLFCTAIAVDPDSDFRRWSLPVAALCHGIYDLAALTYVPLCPVVLLCIILLSEASHAGRQVAEKTAEAEQQPSPLPV